MKIKNQMSEIIGHSYSVDNEERRMLEKIFSRLADYQDDFLSQLARRVDVELNCHHDWDSDLNVSVKLVRRGETVRNFLPINVGACFVLADEGGNPLAPVKNELFQLPFFLDADYDEIKNLCNKNYDGSLLRADGSEKIFSYRLQHHFRFVKRERVLFELAACYHINRPVIFSPFARKAVDVIASGLRAEDLLDCTALNLRNERLIVGHELMWNVDIKSDTFNREPTMGVDGNLVRYNYICDFDKDLKAFVLPAQHCDDIQRRTSDNRKDIIISFNALLDNREYQLVILNDAENTTDAFNNDFPKRKIKLRLRTRGDVENVLACFNETSVGKIFPANYFGSSVGNHRPITLYRREDSFYIPTEERMLGAVNRKPLCVIRFAGDDGSIIKIDYANYVLDYMSRNYPEFDWAGVTS